MIMDSLRYWVLEMHVDGFRFDLASALARGSFPYFEMSSEMVESFKEISNALKSARITPEDAELRFSPTIETELSDSDTVQVLRMVESLEELDDVQNVFHNLSISQSALALLEEA